ncbi:MAG: hypothetical protein IJ635_02930 [Bacteroidaceae bacterium]|nr:hypothetical protein [Bacteroidaceae bacterium]MBR1520171.1 hypothetical protein [Bacteroidaceae bacterium]
MGGNGSFALKLASTEAGRRYKTIVAISDNIKVLQQKNPKLGVKLPEESNTPNRIYVTFYKDGHDVKDIALYGSDGKKLWQIHTQDHHGIKPHFHYWKDGGQEEGAHHLTKEMKALLDKIRLFNSV